MSTDKFCEQSRPAEEFGRPPERVAKSCRARMGRPIADNSETGRQRAKASARKELKKASLIFLIFRQSFEAKSSECR